MGGVTFKSFAISVASAVLLATGACSAFGQPASEDRPVGAFSRLGAHAGVDVYLTQSDTESLRIEVEGFELDDVISEVVGDELVLRYDGPRQRSGFFERHRITAYVNFVQLTAIEASGGSDIEGRNEMRLERLTVDASGGSDVELDVQAERLEFSLSGGSDLGARGSTRSLVVRASGGSDVSARSLAAERAELELSGGSDASVRAGAAIDIDADGASDVVVYGDPADRTVRNDRSSDVHFR